MQIGYARVSSDDQNLDLQNDALKNAGCLKIYEDRMTGAKVSRPGLQMAMEVAREGDIIVVWRLDRLGRSLTDLINLVSSLESRGVGLTSLQMTTLRQELRATSFSCILVHLLTGLVHNSLILRVLA
jgi:DNA invertase Pin-like site-specific DNA recombinase